MSTGIASDLKAIAPPAPSLTIGPSLPGEGFARAAGAIAGLINTVQKEKNTPAEVQAEIDKHTQAAKDEFQRAVQHAVETGDTSWLSKLEAIMPEAPQ